MIQISPSEEGVMFFLIDGITREQKPLQVPVYEKGLNAVYKAIRKGNLHRYRVYKIKVFKHSVVKKLYKSMGY